MIDWGLSVSIGIGLIGIAIFLGLRGFRKDISDPISKIEAHTSSIPEIRDKVVAIDERTKMILTSRGGTVVKEVENIGKVKIKVGDVEGEEGIKGITYYVTFEKPIVKIGFMGKKANESKEFQKMEKEFLKGEIGLYEVMPTFMKIFIPSTDPKKCTEFINFFLNWLSTEYFSSLASFEEFEKGIL